MSWSQATASCPTTRTASRSSAANAGVKILSNSIDSNGLLGIDLVRGRRHRQRPVRRRRRAQRPAELPRDHKHHARRRVTATPRPSQPALPRRVLRLQPKRPVVLGARASSSSVSSTSTRTSPATPTSPSSFRHHRQAVIIPTATEIALTGPDPGTAARATSRAPSSSRVVPRAQPAPAAANDAYTPEDTTLNVGPRRAR